LKIWIYTGGRPSNSAKELSQGEGFRRFVTGKSFKPDDVLVNWGTTKGKDNNTMAFKKVLNNCAAVGIASNKIYTFTALAGEDIDTVPWTQNKAVALEWQAKGNTIVVRNVLTGHSGDGIVIVEENDELPTAPLYTKYIFKTKEFRVHATQTEVIDTQRKVRDPDQEPLSWKVRSHANGFIFQRNNIQPSEARDKLAISAVAALGLDFGAVDIVEDKKGNLYVLEVNTAPGLEGQTVEAYANALEKLANAQ
jgi:hypothetical protein